MPSVCWQSAMAVPAMFEHGRDARGTTRSQQAGGRKSGSFAAAVQNFAPYASDEKSNPAPRGW